MKRPKRGLFSSIFINQESRAIELFYATWQHNLKINDASEDCQPHLQVLKGRPEIASLSKKSNNITYPTGLTSQDKTAIIKECAILL